MVRRLNYNKRDGARWDGAVESGTGAAVTGEPLLAAEQVDTSNTFAKTGLPEQGSLRGVPYHLGTTGVPILDGALASLECEVTERLAGGDHTIVIGRVVHGTIHSDAEPLLYFRGDYWDLGGK